MKEEIKKVRIDFDQLASTLFAGKKIPRLLMRILKKIAHEDGLNELFDSAPGKKNMDFVDACMDFYRIECRVKGIENLPADAKPLIFASNHPLGALGKSRAHRNRPPDDCRARPLGAYCPCPRTEGWSTPCLDPAGGPSATHDTGAGA